MCYPEPIFEGKPAPKCLSVSLCHTHTLVTRTCTLPPTCIHTHTYTETFTLAQTFTYIHIHTHIHTTIGTHTRALTYTQLANTHTQVRWPYFT